MSRQARKYILIPEERYKKLISLNEEKKVVNSDEFSNVKNDLTSNVMKELSSPPISVDKIVNDASEKDKSLEDLLSYFPNKMKSRARLISGYFDKHNSNISWNSDGEVILNGETLKGSSLLDLLYDACCIRRKTVPLHAADFYVALKLNKLPLSFITNRERHSFFKEQGLPLPDVKNPQFRWKRY